MKLEQVREAESQLLLQTYERNPILFVRGEGVHLIDENGERYLDLLSGIGVNALGYAHPRLTKVIREQAGLIFDSGEPTCRGGDFGSALHQPVRRDDRRGLGPTGNAQRLTRACRQFDVQNSGCRAIPREDGARRELRRLLVVDRLSRDAVGRGIIRRVQKQ